MFNKHEGYGYISRKIPQMINIFYVNSKSHN